jgi:hypothetical protein
MLAAQTSPRRYGNWSHEVQQTSENTPSSQLEIGEQKAEAESRLLFQKRSYLIQDSSA